MLILLVRQTLQVYSGLNADYHNNYLSPQENSVQRSNYSTLDNPRYANNYLSSAENPTHKVSIIKGNYKTAPENLESTLMTELEDMSEPLRNSLIKSLKLNRKEGYDGSKFKDVININKNITNKNGQKVIKVHVSEKLVPINEEEVGFKVIDENEKIRYDEFGVRAFAGGALFLFTGLFFTFALKLYKDFLNGRFETAYKKNSENLEQ